MKSVNWPKPGYASITCSTISNIPYNLIFTTKFYDSSILITIITCDYLNLSLADEHVGDVTIPTQVIEYNQNFLQADWPIRLIYSNQIKSFTDNGTVRATPSLQNFNGSFQLCLCGVPADSKKRKACLLNCSKPNMKLKVGLGNSHWAADFGFLKLKTRQLVSNNFYLCFPAICLAPKITLNFKATNT
jgi:hypothetical protein